MFFFSTPSSPFNHLCSNDFLMLLSLSDWKSTWGFSVHFQWGTLTQFAALQRSSHIVFHGVCVLIGLFPGYLCGDSLTLVCSLVLRLQTHSYPGDAPQWGDLFDSWCDVGPTSPICACYPQDNPSCGASPQTYHLGVRWGLVFCGILSLRSSLDMLQN